MIDPKATVHTTAIVDPDAIIHSGVIIGPYTVVGAHVEIGADSVIHSHVFLKGPTKIGRGNQIYQFSSVGEDCQDKKYQGENTRLEIGDHNIIREGCTIHRGTTQDNSITHIGSHNLLMAYTHIAHDCIVGNHCIFANNAAIAGHVRVGDGVIFGGYSVVHQHCNIGAYSMSAGSTTILKDVPAFIMVSGNPAKACGLNKEGMKRRAYPAEIIQQLNKAYKIVYRSHLTLTEAIAHLQEQPTSDQLEQLIQSLQNSQRGIVR